MNWERLSVVVIVFWTLFCLLAVSNLIVGQIDVRAAEKKRKQALLDAAIKRKRRLAVKVAGLLRADHLQDYLNQLRDAKRMLAPAQFDWLLDEPSPHGKNLKHRDFWEYYTEYGQNL